MTAPALPRLRARTLQTLPQPDLFDLLPPEADPSTVVSWVREGDGLIGWGRAAASPAGMPSGADRFSSAAQWWREVVAAAEVVDEVQVPGTGLVAFGSFAFAAESPDTGGLVIPQVVAGQRDGKAWITSIEVVAPSPRRVDESHPDSSTPHHPTHPSAESHPDSSTRRRDTQLQPGAESHPDSSTPHHPTHPSAESHPDSSTRRRDLHLQPGAVPAAQWPAVISQALDRISAGEVEKVVLARDVTAVSQDPIDPVALLRRLANRYAATWTFAVQGLIGATPEMLVRLQHGRVRSRVLAGTVRRDRSPAPSVTETHPELADQHTPDPRLHLVSSQKELEEHAFAVRSVAEALQPHCASLEVPDQPFVLELPDVYHLATDLSGEPSDRATSLDLAAALHPSAAVCGTPSHDAARLIAELEGMDRGRYAGPVGWVDAAGEGDWGIALRCGQLSSDARRMRLFAGGGIVSASDPQAELAETEAKLAAMRHALDLEE